MNPEASICSMNIVVQRKKNKQNIVLAMYCPILYINNN